MKTWKCDGVLGYQNLRIQPWATVKVVIICSNSNKRSVT